jgi:proteasome lid subunit RPN8/RPN11
LSTDDIVFEGEVAYREPERMRRPDRDRRWACLAYEVPGPEDLPIFLDRRPADAIERHALSDTTVELGGILLGKECVDDQTGEPFVWITEALAAKHYENTQASFTYTHDSWEEITRERDRRHPELDIVGWYHTHPDFGIFLSSHDLFIHHNFFAQPLQVAYVVDPIRQTRGFFRWHDGQMVQVGGYYLTADRGDRVALSRLVNDLENIPNTEGGGGGLSPRLEAELIAMLTRPQSAPAAAQSQAAALYGMLGFLLCAVCVAAWFGLQSMAQALKDQTVEMQRMVRALDKNRDAAELTADLERVRAKEAALDAVLRKVQLGDSPDSFRAAFERAEQQRHEAEERLVAYKAAAGVLQKREAELSALKSDLAAQKKANLKLTDDAKKEANSYVARIDKLKEELDDKDRILHEQRTGVLLKKYHYAWYAAIGGWAVSILLALGLVAFAGKSLPAEEPAPAPAPQPQEEPPHRIT